MGAFFLVRRTGTIDHSRVIESLEACLARQEFGEPRRIDRPDFSLRVYNKINVVNENYVCNSDNEFAFSTGTFLYKNCIGAAALTALLEDFDPQRIDWSRLHGHFCVGVGNPHGLHLLTDSLGMYKVYCDKQMEVFSSSFLGVLESLERASINTQSVYEYVFGEATYGNKTVITNIGLVDSYSVVKISDKVKVLSENKPSWKGVRKAPIESHLESHLGNLRPWFHAISKCFGNNMTMGLSGGRDSRLMLALLHEQDVTPHVYVYGKECDVDVQIARDIAKTEGFDIEWIDRTSLPRPDIDAFKAIVSRNFYLFDGYPGSGVFNNGSDLTTRLARCEGGRLMLNAMGAEVYRFAFEYTNVLLTVRQLIRRYFDNFATSYCTSHFSKQAYIASLADTIRRESPHDAVLLDGVETEHIYIDLRCRYWVGSHISVNNRFSWALTPFLERGVVDDAVTLPFEYRVSGKFLGRLIREVNPSLAAHRSEYGHDFMRDPTIRRRLLDSAMYWRKAYLPQINAFRIKNFLRKVTNSPFPYYLQPDYVKSVIDTQFPWMNRFFHVDKVTDAGQFARICTLEYLFEKYQSKLSPATEPLA